MGNMNHMMMQWTPARNLQGRETAASMPGT